MIFREMLNVNEILVTQKKIRDEEQLILMTQFIQSGGFFTSNCLSKHKSRGKISPVIEITMFEDGRYFLHDGHHRAASILLGGRDFIDTTEYRIRNFKYDDYIHPNLSVDWWTPFDPRTEVRLPDMSEYKALMNKLVDQGASADVVLKTIEDNKALYSEARGDILTLQEFVDEFYRLFVKSGRIFEICGTKM